MKGIVLASHGSFARATLESVKLFVGEVSNIEVLTLNMEDNPEDFKQRLEAVIINQDQNEGVLLLTDIPGGTPSNAGLMIASNYPTLEVLTGLNMMMLMEIILTRESTPSMSEWTQNAIKNGQASIQDLTDKLRHPQSNRELSELDDLLKE
jgi:mannose/fructose-specific phosphotransferase system component IIA